ncbi:MAG: hypothetical protein LBR53_08720 [Deltaproteobacteria bacterium]|nr:hypothetical protein [Deltaproteobacteria bacterium]
MTRHILFNKQAHLGSIRRFLTLNIVRWVRFFQADNPALFNGGRHRSDQNHKDED